MEVERQRWKMDRGKVGMSGEYTVQGFKFENGAGGHAWWVSWWGSHGPVRSAWVEDETFSRVMLHFDYGINRIETFGEITDVPAEAKKAVLERINKWEDEEVAKGE